MILTSHLLVLAGVWGAEPPPESINAITPEAMQAHIDHLADDAYYGRYWLSPFGRKAAEWIGEQFKQAGLEPSGTENPETKERSWFQEVDTKDASPNVIGVIHGTDPSAGYYLLGAHYDHLPPKRRGKDRIFNGADDNASGTAALIEIARALVPLKERLRASVVFIAFTGEEAGLKGSKFFVKHPTVPLKSMRGLFNMDMISRGESDLIFIDGAKRSPELIGALKNANAEIGLRLAIDTHPDWLPRSDQWPFLRKRIPAVLFSVEDHEDYHTVNDHAELVLAPLAAKVARLVAMASFELATGKETDPKSPNAVPSVPDTPDDQEDSAP